MDAQDHHDPIKFDVDNMKWAPQKLVDMGDRLVRLRNSQPVWTVIQELMKMWQETNPKTYQSFLVELQDTKDTGKVTNIGGKSFSNVSEDANGSMLRHRLDIPVKVVYMLRRLYSVEELPMDAAFYDKWAKTFPKTVVSEVV